MNAFSRGGDYDVNVILPLSVSLASFGNTHEDKHEGDISHYSSDLINSRDMHRPGWLALSGERSPLLINAGLCRQHFLCIVEARYADESDEGIPADRYVFFEPRAASKLYLRQGRYRLRVMDGGRELAVLVNGADRNATADRNAVANLIRRLHKNSAYTIVLIEHDMRVVFNLADRITVLGEGKLLAEGTPPEIAGNPVVQEAYLGKAE